MVIPPRAAHSQPWTSSLDLLQGAGIAAAFGIRPFLPVLLVGALAAGDLGIDFDGTDFAFLEQAPFLLAIVVLLLAVVDLVGRRARARGASSGRRGPTLFGDLAIVHRRACSARGSLAERRRAASWPG